MRKRSRFQNSALKNIINKNSHINEDLEMGNNMLTIMGLED